MTTTTPNSTISISTSVEEAIKRAKSMSQEAIYSILSSQGKINFVSLDGILYASTNNIASYLGIPAYDVQYLTRFLPTTNKKFHTGWNSVMNQFEGKSSQATRVRIYTAFEVISMIIQNETSKTAALKKALANYQTASQVAPQAQVKVTPINDNDVDSSLLADVEVSIKAKGKAGQLLSQVEQIKKMGFTVKVSTY